MGVLTTTCVHRPVPVYDALPFQPPAVYAEWWRDIERCSGRAGDFEAVRWFVIPGIFVVFDGRLYDGYWFRDGRIVLAEEWTAEPDVVRHEMLHSIVARPGHGEEFREHCRDLVTQVP